MAIRPGDDAPGQGKGFTRTAAVRSGAVALGLWCMVAVSAAAQRQPNIVVIVADDLGYADIGVHGSADIPTPNIDGLARGGIRFTDAYVTGPYCSPTRAGLMTGRYPQRFGHEFNPGGFDQAPGDHGLPLDQVTLADRLKAAGYRTALFGKWHLGMTERFHPMSRGFDEFFGFLGGAHSYVDAGAAGRNPLLEGRTPVAETGYLTTVLADRAVSFIQRQKGRPFFLYLAFNAVHTPMHATPDYLSRFSHISDSQRRTYAAMLAAMDDGIGRTLAALKTAGLEEETLIFFFSDNGGPRMASTSVNGSSNAPLRGSKRQTWEGGIRVPFIVRWKGHLAEGKVDTRPIVQLDVLPTALAAARIPIRSEWKLDGVNLLPFLRENARGEPHEMLYWRLGGMMAIRKGDWKLVKASDGPLNPDHSGLGDLSDAELYDLRKDIGEKRNLAAAQSAKAKELAADWQRWNRELAEPLWAPRPMTAGPPSLQAQTPLFSPAPQSPVRVGRGSGTILLADVNGDGHLDMLTRHLETRTIAVHLGDGSGHFTGAAGSPLRLAYAPADMRLGDLNGDGALDLAVTHSDRDVVEILLADKRGGFAPARGSPIIVSTPIERFNKRTLQLVDLDEDGYLDIVTANGRRRNSFAALLGNGRGRFRRGPIVKLDSGRDGYSFAFGDLDGDGHLDLVTASRATHANGADGRVLMQRGNGKGAFTPAFGSPHPSPRDPGTVTVADLNDDGRPDVLISHGTDLLSVWLNEGGGQFRPATRSPYRFVARPYSLVVADLNRDGRPDVAAATVASISVLLGVAGGLAPAPGSPYPAGPGAYNLGVGDVNGDGKPDIAGASFEGDGVTLLFGR